MYDSLILNRFQMGLAGLFVLHQGYGVMKTNKQNKKGTAQIPSDKFCLHCFLSNKLQGKCQCTQNKLYRLLSQYSCTSYINAYVKHISECDALNALKKIRFLRLFAHCSFP